MFPDPKSLFGLADGAGRTMRERGVVESCLKGWIPEETEESKWRWRGERRGLTLSHPDNSEDCISPYLAVSLVSFQSGVMVGRDHGNLGPQLFLTPEEQHCSPGGHAAMRETLLAVIAGPFTGDTGGIVPR